MLMLQRKTSSDRKEDKRFQDFYLFENHIACSYVRETSKKIKAIEQYTGKKSRERKLKSKKTTFCNTYVNNSSLTFVGEDFVGQLVLKTLRGLVSAISQHYTSSYGTELDNIKIIPTYERILLIMKLYVNISNQLLHITYCYYSFIHLINVKKKNNIIFIVTKYKNSIL